LNQKILGYLAPPFVLFPEKLLKIIATRVEIFSVKFAKYCFAAVLCPNSLWELKRSSKPLGAKRRSPLK